MGVAPSESYAPTERAPIVNDVCDTLLTYLLSWITALYLGTPQLTAPPGATDRPHCADWEQIRQQQHAQDHPEEQHVCGVPAACLEQQQANQEIQPQQSGVIGKIQEPMEAPQEYKQPAVIEYGEVQVVISPGSSTGATGTPSGS